MGVYGVPGGQDPFLTANYTFQGIGPLFHWQLPFLWFLVSFLDLWKAGPPFQKVTTILSGLTPPFPNPVQAPSKIDSTVPHFRRLCTLYSKLSSCYILGL